MTQLEVSPQALTDAAPSFCNAAQTVSDWLPRISSAMQQVLTDAALASEFNNFLDALESFEKDVGGAMACVQNGLTQLGLALEVAGEEYADNEYVNTTIFESVGGDPYPATSSQPGTTPGGKPGEPYPVPVPGPGVVPDIP